MYSYYVYKVTVLQGLNASKYKVFQERFCTFYIFLLKIRFKCSRFLRAEFENNKKTIGNSYVE